MNAAAIEIFLARLYTDDALRAAFLAQPDRVAREAGLDDATCAAVRAIDREDLVLAAGSYASKRAAHSGKRVRSGLIGRLQSWWLLRHR
jgi:hypothetical protein